jgi:hypothetical protein
MNFSTRVGIIDFIGNMLILTAKPVFLVIQEKFLAFSAPWRL